MKKMVISLYLSVVTKITARLDTVKLKAGTVEEAARCVKIDKGFGGTVLKAQETEAKVGEQDFTQLQNIHTAKEAVSRVRTLPQNNVQCREMLAAHTPVRESISRV